MLNICKIHVPTPYLIGSVNCYLIKNHPYTLVDPGPDWEEGRRGLLAGLEAELVQPSEIKRVVLSHWHSDHSGLAHWLSETWGAEVYVHRLDRPRLLPGYSAYVERMPFLIEAGVPAADIDEMLIDRDPLPPAVLPVNRVNLLEGGETLSFDGGELQVMHMPGHSTGHICLYDAESKVFLGGDFILANITPNPFMAAKPEKPSERVPVLAQYLSSLKRMKDMDIRLVLTGHGEDITDSHTVVTKVLEHRLNRKDIITGILDGEEKTAYQVTRALYPTLKGFNILLGVSEVLAYLDYLEEQGRVSREVRDNISYYRLS